MGARVSSEGLSAQAHASVMWAGTLQPQFLVPQSYFCHSQHTLFKGTSTRWAGLPQV